MTYRPVAVRELAGWGLDDYEFRPESFEQDRFITATNLASSTDSVQTRLQFCAVQKLRHLGRLS